jgi:hypothetical protein
VRVGVRPSGDSQGLSPLALGEDERGTLPIRKLRRRHSESSGKAELSVVRSAWSLGPPRPPAKLEGPASEFSVEDFNPTILTRFNSISRYTRIRLLTQGNLLSSYRCYRRCRCP